MEKVCHMLISYWQALNPLWTLLSLLICSALWLWLTLHAVESHRKCRICVLLLYMLLIYSYTVLSRSGVVGKRLELRPFWSYLALMDGNRVFLEFIIMNIWMLFPVGFLFSALNISQKRALVYGLSFSIGIELSQLIFGKGLCELDDVIHNTLGVWLGIQAYRGLLHLKKEFTE